MLSSGLRIGSVLFVAASLNRPFDRVGVEDHLAVILDLLYSGCAEHCRKERGPNVKKSKFIKHTLRLSLGYPIPRSPRLSMSRDQSSQSKASYLLQRFPGWHHY